MRPLLLVLALLSVILSACSEEEATPIDLTPGATTTTTALPPGATPHGIGENPQARFHAEQQCRDDPEQDEGVIRIVDPTNDAVLGKVVVDCDEVREEDAQDARTDGAAEDEPAE